MKRAVAIGLSLMAVAILIALIIYSRNASKRVRESDQRSRELHERFMAITASPEPAYPEPPTEKE